MSSFSNVVSSNVAIWSFCPVCCFHCAGVRAHVPLAEDASAAARPCGIDPDTLGQVLEQQQTKHHSLEATAQNYSSMLTTTDDVLLLVLLCKTSPRGTCAHNYLVQEIFKPPSLRCPSNHQYSRFVQNWQGLENPAAQIGQEGVCVLCVPVPFIISSQYSAASS